MSKTNTLVKLGICLGIPSLALILYFFKRNKEDPEEGDFENTIKCRQTIIEVKVPAECVRSLIGPQGSVVKQIQQKTETRINYKDRNSQNTASSSLKPNDKKNNATIASNKEEIFLVRGSAVNVQRAEIEIKRLILDMGTMFTEEYYVPDYVCGRLIGKNGSSIKEITNASNCKVKIHDNKSRNSCSNNDDSRSDLELLGSNGQEDDSSIARKLLTLSGTTEQIARAKELIMAKIAEENLYREKKSKSKAYNTQYRANYNDFDRYNKNDKTSSYANWSDKYGDDEEATSNHSNDINQILNVPKLINLASYLDENKSVDVVVSAVANPCVFWVQIANKNGENIELTCFTKKMNAFYANNNSKNICYEKISDLKIGMFIACEIEHRWYRGEVKGFKATDDSESSSVADANNILVDIYIADFGDSTYLHFNEIKSLSHEFYDFPLQAIECYLYNTKLNTKYDDWPEESFYYFEEITYTCKWKAINLQLVEWGDNQLPSVKLFDPAKNAYISDLLVQKEYAMLIPTEPSTLAFDLIKPITLTDENELVIDKNENNYSTSSSSSYTE